MGTPKQGVLVPPNIISAMTKSVVPAISMGPGDYAAGADVLNKGWKPFKPEQDTAACWDFTKGRGNPLADLSENENDLTLSGVLRIPDDLGWSYEFDGVNDYLITSGNPTSLQILGELSVEILIKTDALDTRYFMSKWDEGDSNRSWKLGIEGGNLTVRISTDGVAEISATVDDAVSPISTIMHVAFTYKPSTYLRLFVNGYLVKEVTASIPTSLKNSNQNMTLGGFWSTSTLNGDYDGHIYMARITPRAIEKKEMWIKGGNCWSMYMPFEDPNLSNAPSFRPIVPGFEPVTITGNPQFRGGPFVAVPGYGIEITPGSINMLASVDFPSTASWDVIGSLNATLEVGSQFAMDQGEYLKGIRVRAGDTNSGVSQTVTLVSAQTYTPTAWVKTTLGSVKLVMDKGDGTNVTVDTSVNLNIWERLGVSFASHWFAATGVTGVFQVLSADGTTAFNVWMPQVERTKIPKPARVGVQPASAISVSSPISESQTAWSVMCVVTPDFVVGNITAPFSVWSLTEGVDDKISLQYGTDDKWTLVSRVGGDDTTTTSVISTHNDGDKIHLAVTCDGLNAYLYVNGTQSAALAIGSVQPTTWTIGIADFPETLFHGVIDELIFVVGATVPEFRVKEISRRVKLGIPLHGLVDTLSEGI